MKISFQKKEGNPSLNIAFFWMLQLEVDAPHTATDHFIPELFYDAIFVQKGQIQIVDPKRGIDFPLPQQTLKTIHTHGLTFELQAPLTLFGARFYLHFAESFWQPNMPANTFLESNWVANDVKDLASYAAQISVTMQKQQSSKTDAPMFSAKGNESDWLAHFSPRHKRRLYKSVFGISKKEMRAIQGVHAFLGQTCDFSSQNPRIIEYIDSEHFYDQPHLNHAFKKMTGLSPLEHFQACSIIQDNLMAASYNEM